MKPPRTAGKRILARRLALGLSQRAISGPTVTYAYISRIENGQRTPSWSALIEMARKLHTTALELAYGTDARRCPVCQREPSKSPPSPGRNLEGCGARPHG